MTHPLEGRHRDPLFLSQSTPTVVLDDTMVIRAATPSYQRMTQRHEEELVSVGVFDAFPENPEGPGDSGRTLLGSLEHTLGRARGDVLMPIRYDIPDPTRPGRFMERTWVLVSTPVFDGERTIGVSIRVQDVSPLGDRLVGVLQDYADLLREQDLVSGAAQEAAASLFDVLGQMDDYAALGREVMHLRRALRTRPVIEQAKGIVMAERKCDDAAAFAVLRSMSQNSNVPLSQVAAAVVYQATRPR
ncbi:ANTAR domain-containing protein [Nocardioides guangzhouensis]|uniref:ANTAR domain-containing protein n=1 Tax=Nocardioides guangzhouensis TaxID=2497878 RepID=A0A4Q4Z611_9ACTN|nr:ANTAR domain-containing protein [Nocardioides guangzhouensis]RYP82374.1 ANTAR domain-containing protein [Nocardioides guangzhouensis]